MSNRKPISKKKRFDIFKRDGFACQYCGSTPPKAILHVDHINPVANGGKNDEENLITACSCCNLGKGARLLNAVPQDLKSKAAEIAEREEQLRGYGEIMEARRLRLDQEAWLIVHELGIQHDDGTASRAHLISIKRFIDELGIHEVLDAAEIGRAKKPYSKSSRFKYFCGICWNKIKDGANG